MIEFAIGNNIIQANCLQLCSEVFMKKTIWVLLDNRMGSVGQAKGILQELDSDFDVVEKKIVYTKYAALPNAIRGRTFLIGVDTKKSDCLKTTDYPDAVLSISRRTAPIALWIKRKSNGKTKIIQLMLPGKYGLSDMDLVIVSKHDQGKVSGKNLFYITGCPHRINDKTLAEAKEKWHNEFAKLPQPLTAVLVGGSIKGKPFTDDNASMLAEAIASVQNQVSGSILITSSRRTGKSAENIIMNKINGIPTYTYLWGEEKENPIMGFYACADRFIVTGDSVSMTCEACGTGKPVMVFTGKKWLTRKHLRFVQSLVGGKYAINTDAKDIIDFAPEHKLRPSIEAAAKIRELFA